MGYGFVRVSAMTPDIRVADTEYNLENIQKKICEAEAEGVRLAVFPELCTTGYTCSDLFLQDRMLDAAKSSILRLADFLKGKNMIAAVGFPFKYGGNLYNAAAVIAPGRLLGIVPKTNIPNYGEFYELRHFAPGSEKVEYLDFGGEKVPFGTNLTFRCKNMENFTFAVELCEDLWVSEPPSIRHAQSGAALILNLSASDETTGKDIYRKNLVSGQSGRLVCGYVYADAGEGESSTDMVFAAHNIIAENGQILAESERFRNMSVFADIDVDRIMSERRRMNTYRSREDEDRTVVDFELEFEDDGRLLRYVDRAPFVPGDEATREKRCEEILTMQSMGLKKRLTHTGVKTAVVGISGGLDSTLALLVTVKAFDAMNKDRSGIIAVTMPGFGTTDRTHDNAVAMIKRLGVTFKEVPIGEAVMRHFSDIGHDKNVHDTTYENAQARQRTYILMDIAGENGGLVVGTGDMSELALGWATYNGDHMSMYGVNSSVPKTLVRHLVRYYADSCGDEELKGVLLDVLDTPVSPELLPPEKDGSIAQKTEDLVGPYELHDFFLYNILRWGYPPSKVYYLAVKAFCGIYGEEFILKWLKSFYRRFFSQQFKRSCLPDGVKVGSITVSPRGDLRMPSDASAEIWIKELDMNGD